MHYCGGFCFHGLPLLPLPSTKQSGLAQGAQVRRKKDMHVRHVHMHIPHDLQMHSALLVLVLVLELTYQKLLLCEHPGRHRPAQTHPATAMTL